MRLLLVSNTYPPADISGVGTMVSELAAEARRRGSDVRILTRRASTTAAEGVVATGGPKVLFPLLGAWSFLALVRGWQPEVLHVHESDGVLIVLLVRLGRLLRRPWGRSRVVATLQVSYVEERRSVRPLRTLGRIVSRPTPGEWIFAWTRAPLLAILGRLTGRLSDAVIAPSAATGRDLRRDYGIVSVRVIPNGVQARFSAVAPASSASSASSATSILYVGRLRTRKAVAVLLEAMACLCRQDVSVRLIVAGSGEQGKALRSRCTELRLDDRVDFVGAVPRSEIASYYAAAAVFCLPSTYEGLPLAILEAMSAALPVVSTTVAGIPEAVEEGRTGLLVEPEDAAGLAGALERILLDPHLRRSMGQAGKRRFETRFSIDLVAAAHFELFAELVDPRAAKRRVEDSEHGS